MSRSTVQTAAGHGPRGAPLLEVRGLRIEGESEVEWQEIVKGIDLDLRRGEVLGPIGESGAGKSTIGLATMGFLPKRSSEATRGRTHSRSAADRLGAGSSVAGAECW